MPETIAYFAYGSNLHPRRLAERTPSCRFACTAVLFGHRLRFHKRGADASGKADISPSGRFDRVFGAVYHLPRREQAVLDVIEGLGAGYVHRQVTVATSAGPRRALCYQAMPEHISPELEPFDWYHRLVVEGARHHGLPPAYVRGIEAHPTREDPDAQRRAKHVRLVGPAQSGLP